MRPHAILYALLVLPLIGGGAATQHTIAALETVGNSGDYRVVDYDHTGLRVGSVPLPRGETGVAITAGGGGGNVFVATTTTAPTTIHRIYAITMRGVSTVTAFAHPSTMTAIDVDDGGSVLALLHDPAGSGIYRIAAGTQAPQSVATLGAPIDRAHDFAVDRSTGHWLILDRNSVVYRVDGRAQKVASIHRPRAGFAPWNAICEDFATTDLLATRGDSLWRIDTRTGGSRPVAFTRPQAQVVDVSRDGLTGTFLLAGTVPTFRTVSAFYQAYAQDGTHVGTVLSGQIGTTVGARTRDARSFVALGTPAIGTTYSIAFESFLEAGRAYRAAVAWRHVPGVKIPQGTIPLAPDALFFLSLAGPPGFRRMRGTLDARGRTVIELDLPPIAGLRGVPIHLALVTMANGTLARPYGPHTFVVR